MAEQQQGELLGQQIRTPEFHVKACHSGGYVVTSYHPSTGLQEEAVETTTGIRDLAKEFCDACSVVASN